MFSLFLLIILAPVISPIEKTFVADSNMKIQVNCSVPTSIKHWQWYKDGKVITSNKRITKSMDRRLRLIVLIVQDIKLSDAGYYHCKINNNLRSQSSCIHVISKCKKY